MYFDSHVHFDSLDGLDGIVSVVQRSREAGVNRMIAVGGNHHMNTLALEAAESYPGRVYAAIGCDRDQDCGGCTPIHFAEILTGNQRVVAIGEIGLDYYYHPDKPSGQLDVFEKMLGLAREHLLPVIIHSRDSEEETLNILRKHADSWKGDVARIGVLHCFTGSKEFAYKILDMGYHLGFSGIVTFRNADDLRELAAELPSERILIETDTPYLTPEPLRGRRNEPAFLPHIAQSLAGVRGVSAEDIAALTSRNTEDLFGVGRADSLNL